MFRRRGAREREVVYLKFNGSANLGTEIFVLWLQQTDFYLVAWTIV